MSTSRAQISALCVFAVSLAYPQRTYASSFRRFQRELSENTCILKNSSFRRKWNGKERTCGEVFHGKFSIKIRDHAMSGCLCPYFSNSIHFPSFRTIQPSNFPNFPASQACHFVKGCETSNLTDTQLPLTFLTLQIFSTFQTFQTQTSNFPRVTDFPTIQTCTCCAALPVNCDTFRGGVFRRVGQP